MCTVCTSGFVGGGWVGGYERCMTSWGLRKHCMCLLVVTLPLFSVCVLGECECIIFWLK